VAELAELRGISSDRLRREFLQHTGLLPKNYLEQFKLRQAANFLVSTSASVTETAMRYGYMDRYHFSRRFKMLFGISPDQYRKLFAVENPLSAPVNSDTKEH
jgi:AraC-like DNA-binding protein